MKKMLVSLAALICLSGCAVVGVPTPETFNERIAVAYGAVTAVRLTTTTLLQTKQIDADDAQNVQDGANNARAGLDVAYKLKSEAKLTSIQSIIATLRSYLTNKTGGK